MLAYIRTLASKLAAVFGRSSLDAELDSEIRSHLASLEERFVRQGMDRHDARAAARRAFGGIDQLKEANRDHYTFAWLDRANRDIRFALRSLTKNSGFTIVVIATLALGIGANTAIFSVINGVVLQPLPYANGDNLVLVRQQLPLAGVQRLAFSVHDLEDYRSQNSTFSALVEYHEMSFVLLGKPEPERVQTGVVSWNFFDLLGVRPLMGRSFLSSDETTRRRSRSAAQLQLLEKQLWRRSVDRRPRISNERPAAHRHWRVAARP
jgi:putative ABC transport system permease protein